MDWITGSLWPWVTAFVIPTAIATLAVAVLSVVARRASPGFRSQARQSLSFVDVPLKEATTALSSFWQSALLKIKVEDIRRFSMWSDHSGFARSSWQQTGAVILNAVAFTALLVAEFELGGFRIGAVFGLSDDELLEIAEGDGSSISFLGIDYAGALILVVSGVVWANFALDLLGVNFYSALEPRNQLTDVSRRAQQVAEESPNGTSEELTDPQTRGGVPAPRGGWNEYPFRDKALLIVCVLGLFSTLLLSIFSFVGGQVRADELFSAQDRIAWEAEREENVIENDRLQREWISSGRKACRQDETSGECRGFLKWLEDEDNTFFTTPTTVPPPEEPEERSSGWLIITMQVALAISLWGAIGIAGTSATPVFGFLAFSFYWFTRVFLLPVILAAAILDVSIRAIRAVGRVTAAGGNVLVEGAELVGEVSEKAGRAIYHRVQRNP